MLRMAAGTVIRSQGHISAEIPRTEVIHSQTRAREAGSVDSKRRETGSAIRGADCAGCRGARASGQCLGLLTERSEFFKRTEQGGQSDGPHDRHLRRRDGRRGGDLGHPEPAPGTHLRPALPAAATARARGDRRRARAEQEQHLGQHPRARRLAPRAAHAARRFAQGPLRGGERLLARDAGDHGAPLSLERAPGPGHHRRDRAGGGRGGGAPRLGTVRHRPRRGDAGVLRRHRRGVRGLCAGQAPRSRSAEEPAAGGPSPATAAELKRRSSMEPALAVASLWLLFGSLHVGLATRRVRAALVARLGKGGFTALFTVVATACFTLLVRYYAAHRLEGTAGLALGGVAAVRWPLMTLIVAGFVLATASLVSYPATPMALFTETVRPPRGLERITRHPFFMGVALASLAHVPLATRLAGAVFQLGLASLAIAGAWHQDRKLVALRGRPYEDYLAQTSAVPFGAILAGRQRLVARGAPDGALAVTLILALGLRTVHGSIFAHRGALVIR